MKKFISVIMIIALVFSLAGCSGGTSSGAAEESTIDKIVKKGTLVVGTSPGYLPFEMVDTQGNYIGYDIDTANAIAEAMGVKLEIKQYDFSALIGALQAGEIDMIISGMTIRGDRALGVNFADPYFEISQSIMVPSSDTATKIWEDLDVAGKKIAVGQGTTGALLAKQLFKNAEIVDYEGGNVAAMAVAQGQADGMVYDDIGIKMFVLQQPDKLKGIYDSMSVESLGIAVKYGDSKSVDWLNAFLYGYLQNPKEIESRQKWVENTDWLDDLAEEQE